MGFGTTNEYAEKDLNAIKELNKDFQSFQEKVRQRVGEASKLDWVKEICDEIKLYAVILCNAKEPGSDARKLESFLLGEDQGIRLEDGKEYTQIILEDAPLHSNLQERRVEGIENTGTPFSERFIFKVDMIWIAAYGYEEEKQGCGCEERKQVYKCDVGKQMHRMIANTLLAVLAESIRNLGYVKDYSNAFPDATPQKFMEWYMKAIRNCYPSVPDIGIINEVSLHNYERRESCGTVYFVEGELSPEDRKAMVYFDERCRLKDGFGERDNVQGIRKLLEICRNSGNSIVVSMPGAADRADNPGSTGSADGAKSEIIGMLCRPDIWRGKEFISICFSGTKWEMRCGNGLEDEVILTYKSGAYYLADHHKQIDVEAKCRECGISYEIFSGLIDLLEKDAHHGALIIVAEDAEDEVDRLCIEFGRGIKLADTVDGGAAKKEICLGERGEINLDKCRTVLGMANVDGAIFFDYGGNCYGFSVILDGEAKVRGEKKRGARYNSAVNYIKNAKDKRRCAIIRSEDRERGIEIFSNGVSEGGAARSSN